jgi:predicted nucleic acid-binding protein
VVNLRLVEEPPWLPHRTILIDTNIWIYHLNRDKAFGSAATAVLDAMWAGQFDGVASEISLMELLVKPLKSGLDDVAEDYELMLLNSANLRLIPVYYDILILAARLRAQYALKTPDAIIVATGILNGATLAITNDGRWSRITEISVMLLKSEH